MAAIVYHKTRPHVVRAHGWDPMLDGSAPHTQSYAEQLEAAVDQAVAACGGDVRAAVRALIVANEFLETEVSKLMKAASRAYLRGRFQTYSGQARAIAEVHRNVCGRTRSNLQLFARRRTRNPEFFLVHVGRYIGEKRRAQIALAGVGKHAENV